MSMHKAFLAAIEASPTDDEPKLIYADWLEEQGEDEAVGWRWLAETGLQPSRMSSGKHPCYWWRVSEWRQGGGSLAVIAKYLSGDKSKDTHYYERRKTITGAYIDLVKVYTTFNNTLDCMKNVRQTGIKSVIEAQSIFVRNRAIA